MSALGSSSTRGASPFSRSGFTVRDYKTDASVYRTPARKLTVVAGLAFVLVIPNLLSVTDLSIACFAWVAIIGAISLNLLTGYAGQVSLGQAAFLGLGAFTAVWTVETLGVGMWLGIPLAGLFAAFIGLLVGLPSLRFRGFYLALTTLALHFVALYGMNEYQSHSEGGLQGFTLPAQSVFGFELNTDLRWFYFLAVFGLAAMWLASNLVRSRTGRAWMAVRDRDIAAAIVGVDVARAKLTAFMVSSFLAGVAGALMAYYRGNVSTDSFPLDLAITYVAMIIIGGLGSIAGAVIGAVVITALPTYIDKLVQSLPASWPIVEDLQLSIYALQAAIYGLIIVLFLIFESRGLIAIWIRIKNWVLLWPFERQSIRESES
jgi:branched-chain amino acid transport system permease protein